MKTQTFSKLHHSHTKILQAATNPACGVEILETRNSNKNMMPFGHETTVTASLKLEYLATVPEYSVYCHIYIAAQQVYMTSN